MSGVAHEVTNVGHDRDQLANMAKLAKAETAEASRLRWQIAAATNSDRATA